VLFLPLELCSFRVVWTLAAGPTPTVRRPDWRPIV
jgi:hypothetical protein